jgi:hypothetical protein
MSKSKKQPTSVVPKPRYALGQKVYYISEHKGKPEELFEVKIIGRNYREFRSGSSGVDKVALNTYLYYDVWSNTYFDRHSIPEISLYPTYTAAAQVFAKSFLKPLK